MIALIGRRLGKDGGQAEKRRVRYRRKKGTVFLRGHRKALRRRN
jgi:hypothetical protein